MERKVAQLEAEAACMYSAVYSTCMRVVYAYCAEASGTDPHVM